MMLAPCLAIEDTFFVGMLLFLVMMMIYYYTLIVYVLCHSFSCQMYRFLLFFDMNEMYYEDPVNKTWLFMMSFCILNYIS